MQIATKDTILQACRDLIAEGKKATKKAVRQKLGGGSQSTVVKYWPDTIPETATLETSIAEQECNQTTGGSMPVDQDTGAQATAPAPEQTKEEQYHADIARLEAAVQAAIDRYDQAEQALWTQAQRYSTVLAIEAVGGFRFEGYPQPGRWSITPKTEKEAMERLITTRENARQDIGQARNAIRAREVAWGETRWELAFLATPEAQFLTHQLEETRAALETAHAAKDADLVGVLTRRRDDQEKQLAAARQERHQRQRREMEHQGSLAMMEADHRARQQRGV